VRLRMPAGRSARRVQLLAAGRTVTPARQGAELVITVPSVLDHEIVAVDLD
jgi:hypothetical protein